MPSPDSDRSCNACFGKPRVCARLSIGPTGNAQQKLRHAHSEVRTCELRVKRNRALISFQRTLQAMVGDKHHRLALQVQIVSLDILRRRGLSNRDRGQTVEIDLQCLRIAAASSSSSLKMSPESRS